MRDAPEELGERVVPVMQREHGDRWRALLATNGEAWLRIADESATPDADLYEGRLSELRVPTMVIHGARDPRTEPGEIDALRAALDRRAHRLRQGYGGPPKLYAEAEALRHFVTSQPFVVLPEGGHSPHSERATAGEVTCIAQRFLSDIAP